MEIQTYTKTDVNMESKDLEILRNAYILISELISVMDKTNADNVTCDYYHGGRTFSKDELQFVTDILEDLQNIDEIF